MIAFWGALYDAVKLNWSTFSVTCRALGLSFLSVEKAVCVCSTKSGCYYL